MLTKSVALYGQVGLRADYMVSHSPNVESYFYPEGFYVIEEDNDLKKLNYGVAMSPGIEKSFNKTILRLEYSKLLNFNKIINAKGPRLDGMGDAGFFLKLNSFTAMWTFTLAFKL